ncbi:uncharacterized protein LOC124262140 isoform X2 [Haliotis rubra]|nr:uncharacterized protein LOC124262140 isoform X2 [Haliotis rubra]
MEENWSDTGVYLWNLRLLKRSAIHPGQASEDETTSDLLPGTLWLKHSALPSPLTNSIPHQQILPSGMEVIFNVDKDTNEVSWFTYILYCLEIKILNVHISHLVC